MSGGAAGKTNICRERVKKAAPPGLTGSHLEWEFARSAIENLACDGRPLRWPLSFLVLIIFSVS